MATVSIAVSNSFKAVDAVIVLKLPFSSVCVVFSTISQHLSISGINYMVFNVSTRLKIFPNHIILSKFNTHVKFQQETGYNNLLYS